MVSQSELKHFSDTVDQNIDKRHLQLFLLLGLEIIKLVKKYCCSFDCQCIS